MIEARAQSEKIRQVYNLFSYFYKWLAEPFELKPKVFGLEQVAIQPQDKVLEVAFGPGTMLLKIIKKVDRTNRVFGVDLSPKMLARTHQLINKAGYSNVDLREANARQLPFPEKTFDVLYNSYMFDLLLLRDMPIVLSEFKRVLKPGGRVVLVNMSKKEPHGFIWWERIYQRLPVRLCPYLTGGCRPVLTEDLVKEAGFDEVKREFMGGIMPSEVVVAKRPST